MNIITTTIRIDKDVRDYAKIIARQKGMTFMAYYEDLLLKDLKATDPELYDKYYSGRSADNAGASRKRSILAKIYDPNEELINSKGEIIRSL